MSVAVFIPVWNRAKTLGRAIESALAQEPDDILVIDDASTDGSLEVARKYPVRIVSHPSKSENWIKAMKPALETIECGYIIGMGADDVLLDGFVRAVRGVEADNAGVAWSNYALMRDGDPMEVMYVRRHEFDEVTFLSPEQTRRRFASLPHYRMECGVGAAIRRDLLRWLNEHEYWTLGPWSDSIGYTLAAIKAGCVYLPGVHGGFVVEQSEPSYHQRILRDADATARLRDAAIQWLKKPDIKSLADGIVFQP